MGVPPNHSFLIILIRFSLMNHPFWGTTMTMETPMFNFWAQKCMAHPRRWRPKMVKAGVTLW